MTKIDNGFHSKCSVCQLESIAKEESDAEYEALIKLLSDKSWSLPALTRAFFEQGYSIPLRSLERHVASICTGRQGQAPLRTYMRAKA